ncbi:Hpt domain-containing protein [Salinarimonas sp.]|uniref:Hpt domain-containing protein n=1 Tax=Salinarimonas sp. TaxID=2766526 RepID=UPI0032D9617E
MRIIPAPGREKGAGKGGRTGPAPRRREIVPVPESLRAKALAFDRDTVEALDEAAARAEAAEEEVRAAFAGHLGEEIERLADAVAALSAGGRGNAGARSRVYRLAHRLRGTAAAFEAGLLARMAGSLARLLERAEGKAPPALIAAHVDALRAAERRGTPPEDPVATALAGELEAAVTKAAEKARRK